jgi:hypothetical protein
MSWSLAQFLPVAIENQDFVLEFFLAILMAVWSILMWFLTDWVQKIWGLVVGWSVLILVLSSLILSLDGLKWVDWSLWIGLWN